jgi:ribosomal protein S2
MNFVASGTTIGHDGKLNDKNMAKFVWDIKCYININDIELADER